MNKKFLAVAIAGAMSAPMAAQAVKYSLSGQVNRAIVFQDDGTDSQVRNVDATSSGTRFRLRGSEDLGNGMQVGFYWELQTSSNGVADNNPQSNGDASSSLNTGGNLRQANVFFSGPFGKLTLGQTDGAGNGATEADLSGTGAVSGSYMNTYTGGMAWRTSNGNALRSAAPGTFSANGQAVTLSGVPVLRASADGGSVISNADTYSNLDAYSRYDQIRYDTPALGPVSLSASVGNASRWEVAGRLNTGMMGGKVSAALFYGQDHGQSNADRDNYGGSLSYLFAQGTSIGGHYSYQDNNNASANPKSWSVKLGHQWGPHAVSIGYGMGEDFVARDYEQKNIAVAYVHSLKKANAEIYALFDYQQLDTPTGVASVEDHTAFTVGARVKFD